MKITSKRLLALLLSVIMVISMLPVTALADTATDPVATIDTQGYATLEDALTAAAATDDDTVIQLADGEFEWGSVKFPATLKNTTIKGADNKGTILKNSSLVSSDGNAVHYEGITIDGIVFDNSQIVFTGARGGEVVYKNWTITNCEFKDINSTANAAVHFNLNSDETFENLTFTNNVIDGVSGTGASGLRANYLSGNVTVTGNNIQNVAWNAIQLINAQNLDSMTIEDNILASDADEGIANLHNVTAASLSITGNQFNVKDEQPGIAYLASGDVSGNYWGGGAPANLPEGVTYTTYYTALNADGTIDPNSKEEEPSAAAPVAKIGETTYTSLQDALDAAVLAGDTVTVTLLDDIDLTGTIWTPVYFDSYRADGANTLVIDGQNKTITGLSDMLFSGVWTGTKLEVKNLTIDEAEIQHDVNDAENIGVGAIIGNVSAVREMVLTNVKLTNSHVEGGHWTGGLVGYVAGYSGNDGPVFTTVTVTGCEITNSIITGKGSVGGVVGHATGDAWTAFNVESASVSNNTITSTGSSTNKAGAIMGTIGAAGTAQTTNGTTLTGGVSVAATVSGNTVTSNNETITTIYGRQGSATGMLEVAGGTYDKNPIEENVSYAAPKEGFEIKANDNGTYGVVEKTLSGTGTAEDPFQINTADDLKFFRDSVNGGTRYNGQFVKLTADIDLNDEEWTPIGDREKDQGSFLGTFDGGDHTISNLRISEYTKTGAGFFSKVGLQSESVTGTVKNVTFNNVTIVSSQSYVGVIAQAPSGALIENVHITGSVTIQGYGYVGGIVGHGYPTINSCSVEAEGDINASYWGAGAILGFAGDYGARINNATVTGIGEGLSVFANLGGAASVAGSPYGAKLDGATVSNVAVTSNSDYCMSYVAGGGSVTNVTMENVTATASGQPITPGDVAASVNGKLYFSLQEAIDAAANGGTVTLLKDIELDQTVTVPAGSTVTLELNGKTISQEKAQTEAYAMIENNGTLTIKDSGDDGKISYKCTTKGGEYVSNTITNKGVLNVEDGTIESLSSVCTDGYPHAIDVYPGSVTNITGGTVVSEDYDAIRMFCNSVTVPTTVNISGGTIINRVTLQNPDNNYNSACYGVLNITGGSFQSTTGKANVRLLVFSTDNSQMNASISGGTFDQGVAISNNTSAEVVWKPLTGGTYAKAPSWDFVADDATIVRNDDGTYGVIAASVAQVGAAKYDSLAEAINAANGQTVILLSNVTLTETVTVPAGMTVTLDLNGKTVSMADASGTTAALLKNNGTLTIKDSDGKGKLTFNSTTPSATNGYASNTISNYGTLTIEGGTIENTTTGGACYALDNYAGSTATIKGGKLTAQKTTVRIFNWTNGDAAKATLNINGGEIFSEDGYGVNLNLGNTPEVVLNITGGKITTNDTDYNLAVYVVNKNSAENVEIQVSGGTFDGAFALNGVTSTTMAKNAVSITGGTFENVICYAEPAYGFVSAGVFSSAIDQAYCAEGLAPAKNSDGTYSVGTLPNAEVKNLGVITVKNNEGDYKFDDIYYVYDLIGKTGLSTSSEAFDLQIAMEFIAKDSTEQAAANAFGNYTTDFYITMSGMKGDSIVGDADSYLAGYYPGFGDWVKIPLDGFTVENGKVYPVITAAGFDFKYTDICDSVQDFICGIHLSDAILEANPDLTVKLELGLSENMEAAQAADSFITVDEPYVYDVDDMMSYVAKIGEEKFTSLQAAIDAAQTGETITMLDSVELTTTVTIPAGKTLTLDLNGKTVSGTCNASQAHLIMIDNTATLTVKDSSTEQTGKLTYAQGSSNVGWTIDVEGALVLESGTIELTGSWSIGYAVDVRPNAWGTAYTAPTVFTMKGGKVVSSDGAVRVASSSADSHTGVSASFIMEGGKIDAAWDGVFIQQSNEAYDVLNFTMNGGTIESDLNPIRVYGPVPTSYVNGQDCMNIALNGGTMTYTSTETRTWIIEGILRAGNAMTGELLLENGDVTASQTFAQNNTAEGFKWVENNGVYELTAVTYAADVDGTKYETFAEALADIKAGSTLTLLRDVTIAAPINVTANLTIDGNGHTLTYTGSDRAITVENTANGANLTVKNLTVDCNSSYCQRGINYNTTGALVLDNVTVKGTSVTYAVNLPSSSNGATVTIKDSAFSGCIALNVWGANAVVNATDTAFTSVDKATHENYAAVKLNSNSETGAEGSVITITRGSITAKDENGAPSSATTNATATGKINISDSTDVTGAQNAIVAIVRYGDADEFYGCFSLQEAVDKAVEGGNDPRVVLLTDIEISEPITVTGDVVIDGNGKTLTYTGSDRAIDVTKETNGADLTVKNLTVDCNSSYCQRGINYNTTGALVLDNVTVKGKNLTYAVNLPSSSNGATVTIEDSELSGLNTVNIYGEGAKVTIDNTTIICLDATEQENYGTIAAMGDDVEVTVSNSKMIVSGDSYGGMIVGDNANVTFTGTIGNTTVMHMAAKLTTGGLFATLEEGIEYVAQKSGELELIRDINETFEVANAVTVHLNGHTITGVTAAEGYRIVVDESAGTWKVERDPDAPVAEINGNQFASIEEALAAAVDGDTITLLADDTAEKGIMVWNDITLDLNGKTLTAPSVVFFSGSQLKDSTDGTGLLKVANKNQVVLASDNTQMPLYDTANGGYRLFNFVMVNKGAKLTGTTVKFGIGFTFDNENAYSMLKNNASGTGMSISLDLQWTGLDVPKTYKLPVSLLATYASNEMTSKGTYAIAFTVKGLDKLADGTEIHVTPTYKSIANVTKTNIAITETKQ